MQNQNKPSARHAQHQSASNDTRDVERAFREAMQQRGLVPPKRIIGDGNIHICDTRAKNGRGDGRYLFHDEGRIAAGGFQNWQDGAGWDNWKYNPGRELTVAEREEVKRKAEAIAKAREHAQAQKKAARLWDVAPPCPDAHEYLRAKCIGRHAARSLHGCLIVPVQDIDEQIHSIQFIRPNGSKRFLKGGRVTGRFHRIGGDERIIICEGFATAASIAESTGATVIAAFDAGNLKAVAQTIKQKYPGAVIIIGADDDHRTKGNPGITKAREAARAIDAKVAVPEFGPNRRDEATDFNDLARLIGADAVRRCINAATAPESSRADRGRAQGGR